MCKSRNRQKTVKERSRNVVYGNNFIMMVLTFVGTIYVKVSSRIDE